MYTELSRRRVKQRNLQADACLGKSHTPKGQAYARLIHLKEHSMLELFVYAKDGDVNNPHWQLQAKACLVIASAKVGQSYTAEFSGKLYEINVDGMYRLKISIGSEKSPEIEESDHYRVDNDTQIFHAYVQARLTSAS